MYFIIIPLPKSYQCVTITKHRWKTKLAWEAIFQIKIMATNVQPKMKKA